MSQLLSAADFIRRHLPANLGGHAPKPAPQPPAQTNADCVHCMECDAILPLTSRYLRCRVCRASICDTPGCQQAHGATHADTPPTAAPAAPEKPYAEPPLPAGTHFRCAACRRPLTPGSYRNCGLCPQHVCRGPRCQADHFVAHRVAAVRAAKANLQPAPAPEE